MKHSERSVVSPTEVAAGKGRRVVAAALLTALAVSGCAAKPTAGAAVRAPQTTTTQEVPTPVSTAPTTPSPSPESHPATPTTSSAELAKSVSDSMETVVRRMEKMDGFETGSLEDGNKWVAATVVAPTGSQLAPLVEPGNASAYRFYLESSQPDTVSPVKATIGAYYNTNSDGSPSAGESAAFELVATQDEGGAWSLAGRTEGGVAPWTLEGPEALDHASELLYLAQVVSEHGLVAKPMMPYAQS